MTIIYEYQSSGTTYLSTGAQASALIGTVSALKQSNGLVSAEQQGVNGVY